MANNTVQQPQQLPAAPPPPQHNVLISIPRTASHLLTHTLFLPAQPSITPHPRGGYFFLPALSHRLENSLFTRSYETWDSEEREDMDGALQKSFNAWRAWTEEAEKQGKGTYVKEHVNWTLKPWVESSLLHRSSPAKASAPPSSTSCSNDGSDDSGTLNVTAVPKTFWDRTRVTLLIRHPALTFPSCFRTSIDNEGLPAVLSEESKIVQKWECTYRWHVLLYQLLIHPNSKKDLAEIGHPLQVQKQGDQREDGRVVGKVPLIIDASQLRSLPFIQRYASFVGLDSSLVRTSWPSTPASEQENLHAIERRMKDTLLSSTGVLTSKLASAHIDISVEKDKWEVDFGEVLAERLYQLVIGAMGDYEWLYERRWRY